MTTKPRPWNKGFAVGQREALTQAEVRRIRTKLAERGDVGLRDYALFNTGLDTMLHISDLLSMRVRDVMKHGDILSEISVRLAVRLAVSKSVQQCTLSSETRSALKQWIEHTGKKSTDYLFTGRVQKTKPLTPRQASRLIKQWVEAVGLDPALYGTETLRRTRALHILQRTGNVEALRALLGLKRAVSVVRYLASGHCHNPLAISQKCEM